MERSRASDDEFGGYYREPLDIRRRVQLDLGLAGWLEALSSQSIVRVLRGDGGGRLLSQDHGSSECFACDFGGKENSSGSGSRCARPLPIWGPQITRLQSLTHV